MSTSSSSPLPTSLAAGVVGYLSWRYLDDKFNISSDVEMASRLLGLKADINKAASTRGFNTTKLWYQSLNKTPNKDALIMLEDDGRVRKFTFTDLEKLSNRIAHYLQSLGLQPGDTCALFMENRPEFVASWLGMTKIGVKVAMINTSIKQKGLVHCVKISKCKVVLFGSELVQPIEEIRQTLHDELGSVHIISQGGSVGWAPNMDDLLGKFTSDPISSKLTENINALDAFGYIYTSGTTGLPKAAVILHLKMLAFGGLMGRSFVVTQNDVVYTVLPLFHSAGGGLGIGMMLYANCTVVLRKKFSASRFFEDCAIHKCTVVQYIGELCRFLLATPKSDWDKKHKVRIAIGNGLRAEIWNQFQTRFNIPEIGEFYGATEGNAALVNHCRTKEAQGACGRQGFIMRHISGIKFAKFDVLNETIVRGPDGRCIECAIGEPGELLFPIKATDPSTTFAGYEDPKATAKKICSDAFVVGDKYFMTGDLLSLDAKGYIRFVDRIGDTFRFKGENCSTTEVGEVVSVFPGVAEANVYGVLVPNNQDGRAPCCAITPVGNDLKNIDLTKLAAHCKKNLPSYSVPLFLRIQKEMEATATMKQVKGTLKQEGIDISIIKDPMYYLDGNTYVPLTPQVYAKITKAGARL
jgi:acyl-CoA synthetase (AMP-forming)/AMP-acid ligase II